jgi:hypothetical protein
MCHVFHLKVNAFAESLDESCCKWAMKKGKKSLAAAITRWCRRSVIDSVGTMYDKIERCQAGLSLTSWYKAHTSVKFWPRLLNGKGSPRRNWTTATTPPSCHTTQHTTRCSGSSSRCRWLALSSILWFCDERHPRNEKRNTSHTSLLPTLLCSCFPR